MMVAVDTCILLDILLPNQKFFKSSYALLDYYGEFGSLILSELVYSELSAVLQEQRLLDEFLSEGNIRMVQSCTTILWQAGQAWRSFVEKRNKTLQCPACGRKELYKCPNCGSMITSRQHIMADFIIGAHALESCGKLLTRDRGIFKTYFPDLQIQSSLA